ncbi:MAG: AbrB family transcriptional regulator [Microcoleaceae cyanobacterium]
MVTHKSLEPLIGDELLDKIKELSDLSKEEKAIACGYYQVNKQGAKRINMSKFRQAILAAQGIILDNRSDRNMSKNNTYRLTVQSNGNILIGVAYTRMMNLQPGDEFEISVGRDRMRLRLINQDDHYAQAIDAQASMG